MTGESAANALTPAARVRSLPPSALVLLGAIFVTGSIAASRVAPVLWLVTAVVGLMIGRAAIADTLSPEETEVSSLPGPLRRVVRSPLNHLPVGDARRLVLDVVRQARVFFNRDESAFDDAEQRAVRQSVVSLVDACCATSLELARLDSAFASSGGAADGQEASAPRAAAQATRALFVKRLADAATALAALYTSGIVSGTPASDRVAELVTEIRAGAAARTEAKSELHSLLGDA